MSMKIRVLERPIEEVKSTWEGVTRTRHQQWAVMEIDGLPTAFAVAHNAPEDAHAPGEYELDAKSFTVQNGRLTMNRCVLRAVSRADVHAVKPAAAKA